jgi:hypothetical protein
MGDRPWNDDDDDNRPEPPDLQRFYHQLDQLHTEALRIRRSIAILGVCAWAPCSAAARGVADATFGAGPTQGNEGKAKATCRLMIPSQNCAQF